MTHRQHWLVSIWLGLLLLLAACSRPAPEAELRQLIADAVKAAEEHKISDLRALMADDYADANGLDRKAVENLIRLHILRQQSIHLFVRVNRIEFPEPQRAMMRLAAAMAGRPVARADELVGLSADLYRFDLEWGRYGDDWKIRRAAWEPAKIDDFW